MSYFQIYLDRPNSSWAQSDASRMAPPEPRGLTRLPWRTNLGIIITRNNFCFSKITTNNLWMVLSAKGCNWVARNWVQVKIERKSLEILSINACSESLAVIYTTHSFFITRCFSLEALSCTKSKEELDLIQRQPRH